MRSFCVVIGIARVYFTARCANRARFLVAQEYPEATELFELLPDGGRRTLRLMGQFIGPPPR